ncbi:cytochrome P450 [Streptomyces sp. CB03238]|uniref:cytochrome P450 family protein n=1 Tax=Streptomyces sp. CB03238 TaxID=1907777 RepID=UPI001F4E74DA|nr:cytochrome P450 [Streptomyces sp. CB03238]
MSDARIAALTRLDEKFLQNPHELFGHMRGEQPAQEVILPRGIKVWLVTSYADVRTVLTSPAVSKDMLSAVPLLERHSISDQPQSFEAELALAGHMLNTDPPDHTRLRALVNKAFTTRRVERLRGRVEQAADELLDAMAGHDEVDLLSAYAFPLPTTVICELLGVPDSDKDEFRDLSITMTSAARHEEMAAAALGMADYLMRLVESKRDHPLDDLLSALVHARNDEDRLTDPELRSMAFLLLVAGHETTVNLIGNSVMMLLRDPDQLAALRADPALLPGAVEEFLRLEGPLNIATYRYTTQPLRLGDVVIPEGEFVMVSLSSANRDGSRFPDADRLDITRDASGHMAFGYGIHYCVGAPLARMEAEIAIGKLLHRFPALALAEDPETLRWRPSTLIRGLETLPVRLR